MLKKIIAPLVITLVLAINLGLGLPRLSTYSAVDEPYWTYGRVSKFWTAVAEHKWKSTNVNDKPGITVAILSGFGLMKYDPMPYESLRGDVKTDQQLKDLDAINFYFRLPIFLFCTFMLLFFYFFLKKLFNDTVALFGFLFIGLSPIIFGISLIINPDSLLWIFLPLSILSWMIFQKEEKKAYLIASGIFLGLSLLTKYVANILYIFFFFLPFLEYIFIEKKTELPAYLKKSFVNYLLIAAVSMATFYVLYPATWSHPKTLLAGTFLSPAFEKAWPLFVGIIIIIVVDIFLFKNKVTAWILDFFSKHKTAMIRTFTGIFILTIAFTFANTYLGMKPFDLEAILSSPKGIGAPTVFQSYAGAFIADTYSLIFGISPLALIALVAALIFNLIKRKTYSDQEKTVFYFSLFIMVYYFASSFNDVAATVRYQIALYPLALIIGAIGLSRLISSIKNNRYSKYISGISVSIVIFLILAISMFSVKPFYFAYASSLLPQQYILNTKDMGDGSYEAAQYLNSLPNARNLIVWSDKGAACSEFVGTCNIGFTKKDLAGKNFDYFIISSGRMGRSLKLSGSVNDIFDFRKIYSSDQYLKNIILGGRTDNFVRIVSADILSK